MRRFAEGEPLLVDKPHRREYISEAKITWLKRRISGQPPEDGGTENAIHETRISG